jgi:hypothetical protein
LRYALPLPPHFQDCVGHSRYGLRDAMGYAQRIAALDLLAIRVVLLAVLILST